MLDQSFTIENFRKIFDYENRKGSYLEGRYFPEIEQITKQIKNCVSTIKKLNIKYPDYETKKILLNEEKKSLKNKKEELLQSELEKICKNISEKNFTIKIIKVDRYNEKSVYSIDKSDVCSYFVIKQIQHNIKKLYKVQQNNRYNIICQLSSLLNNSFPKYIVRTDISEFYESIPREKLLNKINKDGLLSLSTRYFIKDILNQYENLSGSSKGIPRGIGISAYLSELYMRDFDSLIKEHPAVIYYARYVDDIIVIYAPNTNSPAEQFFDGIEKKAEQSTLLLNYSKTKKIDLTINKNGNFDYLGYSFNITNNKVILNISNNKIDRYKKRIDLSLISYKKEEEKINEKKARKLLIKRFRFLAGNTRLSNNKDNALVGVYFSNSLISDSLSLKVLDHYVKNKTSIIKSEPLKVRLNKISFQEAWKEKKFYSFSPKELKEIVKIWKK